ncbi:Transcription factor [Penicillium sp. IBT 35674x]|nr:Transcription factor [Penicillium sp. IBT 35674x]
MAVDSQSARQDQMAQNLGHFLAQRMSHHNASRSFAPLAPGPPRVVAPQSSMAVSKPKKNSTACLACKAAKRKCSGPPSPCKACVSAGAENDCHFDPSKDLRRRVAVNRTIQELTDHKDLLESVLSTLRSADMDKVNELVMLVRSNGSLNEIAHAVGSPVTRFTDSKVLSAASLSLSEAMDQHLNSGLIAQLQSRRNSDIESATSCSEQDKPKFSPQTAFDPYARVTLENLCDVPLLQVPAKPWTEITDDNDLVSHLVSLYFTWDHPCVQFLDQKKFLEHMRRGVLDSEFCSPLLVNSILSMASTYSDRADVFSDPEDTFSRGQKFLSEAERLFRAEEGAPRLTTVQALLLMCYVLSCQGKANLSWQTLAIAIQMGRDLGLFGQRNGRQLEEVQSQEILEVHNITAWSIFSLNLQMSTKLQRDHSLVQPANGLEVGGDNDCDWTPYPRSNQVTFATLPACLPQIRRGLSNLTQIQIHIHGIMNEEHMFGDFSVLLGKAEGPYSRLQEWLATWPDTSKFGKEPIPQLLILRLQCLQAVTNLLELLIERDSKASVAHQLRQQWREYMDEMSRCLRLYRTSYGLRHIPSQLVAVVKSGLHALLYQLEEAVEARDVFIELSRLAIGLSQRFKPIANSVSTIISLSQCGTANLPPEAIAILHGFEN